MATLVKALVGGVPTLIDASSLVRDVITATNGATALTAGMNVSKKATTPPSSLVPADYVTGKPAFGFVLSAVAPNGTATVFTSGQNTSATGLTDGEHTFISTAGQTTTIPPEPAAGQISQCIGFAVGTTNNEFNPQNYYTR